MPEPNLEIEIKLRAASAEEARQRLRGLRARTLGRVFERNTLFDTHERVLGRSGRLLRVRYEQEWGAGGAPLRRPQAWGKARTRAGRPERALLTFKAPAERGSGGQPGGGRYKARQEIELAVAPAERAEQILERLGYHPWFRYEKYRTSFRLPGLPGLAVELDETPLGVYWELEGPPEAIDRAARALGYGPGDYLTASYYELFLAERQRRGREARAMVFPKK